MVNNGKLQYDYPVYWKKSDEMIDTVDKPLTRRLKRDKVLKELSDKYAKLFDLVMKSPNDYKLSMYFCEARLKLNKYLILQMGINYLYRFLYCEKVFQKHERDLICLDILNVEKFDLDLERFQLLRKDFSRRKAFSSYRRGESLDTGTIAALALDRYVTEVFHIFPHAPNVVMHDISPRASGASIWGLLGFLG